jgi:hypothetical protein
MFQKASRLKLRFDSPKGLLTVEDLWDLPLTSEISAKPNINAIAQGIIRQLKATQEESFVAKKASGDSILQLQLDILTVVRDVKLVEAETAAQAKKLADQKQLIGSLIEQKRNEKLAQTPLEELEKQFAAM